MDQNSFFKAHGKAIVRFLAILTIFESPGGLQNLAEIPKINDLPPRLTQPFLYQDEPDIYSAANASMSPIFISSDCGYYGDPAASEYKTGERLFHVIVKELKEFMNKFAKISVVTNFGLK